MDRLRRSFLACPVRTTDELGLPAEAREAVAFALLGAATLDGLASNVPSATGARRAVALGSITPRP
jgi:anhydro-N-acetylmuramic acid kinase